MADTNDTQFEQWLAAVADILDKMRQITSKTTALTLDILSIDATSPDAQTLFNELLAEKAQIALLWSQYDQERKNLAAQSEQFPGSQTKAIIMLEFLGTVRVAIAAMEKQYTATDSKRAEINSTRTAPSTVDAATGVAADAETTNSPVTGIAIDDVKKFETGSVLNKSGLSPSITDPSALRLSQAGLLKGGGTAAKKTNAPVVYSDSVAGMVSHDADWRIRITLGEKSKVLYRQPGAENNILAPLVETGVIFPYTPSITVSHQATYQPQKLTHANYQSYFYDSSEVQAIQITAGFTAQNITEGRYVLAMIHFFRSATKMFFGKSEFAGNPPPIVFLDGYGTHYFPHVPCVVTSFSHTMPPDVDYIAVPVDISSQKHTQVTRVPTDSQVVLTLQPVYSRANIHKNFSLEDFANGNLIKGNGGFI